MEPNISNKAARSSFRMLRYAICLAMVAAVVLPLHAQLTVTIQGRVYDTTGAGISQASVIAVNSATGFSRSVTANATQGGLRYDHDLTLRVFAFVGADFMSNALQFLGLRSVGSAGLGLHAIKVTNTTLDLLAGGNYTHETYHFVPPAPPSTVYTPGVTNNFAALTLGEELMHKHGGTVITQKLYFYPDLSDTGEYRATFDLGTVTKISKWLGWQNAFGDSYVTNPPAGRKQNDIVLTTGLNFSFAH